jgi:arylsulfatase A-like enzyme
MDLLATTADLLDAELPDDAGEDSVSLLPVLRGDQTGPARESIVHHSIAGAFAIREGRWKLLLTPDSGGWSAPRPGSPESSSLPPVQLYDLEADPGERVNLQDREPERVARMLALLEAQVHDGRSTPGRPQPNDGAIDIHQGRPPAR